MITSLLYWISILLLPLVAILIYFRIANRWLIVDKPNMRSSHNYTVIRGAGIIFPISFLIGTIFYYYHSSIINYYALASCILVSSISFQDDLVGVNYLNRIIVQLIAGLLMLKALDAFQFELWMVLGLLVLLIGTFNTFNFMDGINGITGFYSLVALISMQGVVYEPIFDWVIGAVIVFLFFNARKRAKCFCGDVGAVSLAFIVCYGIGRIIIFTGHFQWILLLAVYGIDSVLTICFRLIRRENIFQAHRTHLYQYLTNHKGHTHFAVAFAYATIQVLINFSLFINHNSGYQYNIEVVALFVFIGLLYFLTRLFYEGRSLVQSR